MIVTTRAVVVVSSIALVWMSCANGQQTTSAINTTNSSALPYNPYTYYKVPPWGMSSFGYVDEFGSHYRGASGFADIVRPGWSWTRRELHRSAPFCYDTLPGRGSQCFSSEVKQVCEEKLGGISAYQDTVCLPNKDQPFAVLGPVCWNQTCYAEETKTACDDIGAFFIGILSGGGAYYEEYTTGELFKGQEASYCVIPGDSHTIIGPACYGKECFTKELADACQDMGGTNFADRFCLVDASYTVIGPICTPTTGPIEEASVCHPEETKALCDEMNGINIGDIFCVVKGDYTVLGPFCTAQYYTVEPDQLYSTCATESEGKEACTKLSGRSVGKGMFCVLNGIDYHLLGPLCDVGGGCWVYNDENNDQCEQDLNGTAVGSFSCIFKGDYTIVGPSNYGNVRFGGDTILADDLNESQVFSPIEGADTWYVINGSFSVIGPTCYASSCYDGDCIKAGGSRISSIFCVIPEGQHTVGSESSTSSSASERIGFLGLAASLLVLSVCIYRQNSSHGHYRVVVNK